MNIDPTQEVIQWFLQNKEKYDEALHGVCYWEYDPSTVNFEDLAKWTKERIGNIDIQEVDWTKVFCELFL